MAKKTENKGSDSFIGTIKTHIESKAYADEDFREHYANPKKTIQDCCNSIIAAVQKSKRNGFDDKEVYDLAEQYYTGKETTVKGAKGSVVVNHKISLSESEINDLRKQAREKVIKDEMDRMKGKTTKPVKVAEKKEEAVVQVSMF